ncbi:MAG: glycerate kinase [Saprospiraceae bacterium]|nr:glycerate kinase [Lewinella sp.]
MKIIVAPDKFKGSLSAREVCEAVKEGVLTERGDAEVIMHPLADGGEGSLDILASHLVAVEVETIVLNPLFQPVRASFLMNGDAAYIEMARASGLPLLRPDQRSARRTTTFGTGQLIRNALQRGARRIFLFVGGSATTDAGIGMASALGYRFLDAAGRNLRAVGENLARVHLIDASHLMFDPSEIEAVVVSDVLNPLHGPEGAAHVFAPQKGADQADVVFLDEGLRHLAGVIERDLGKQVADLPGAGAAGGLGAGGVAFLNASIQSGIESIIAATSLERQLPGTGLIITGEGMFDQQSLQGKVVSGVARLAKQYDIPVVVIAGNTSMTPEEYRGLGIRQVYTVMQDGWSLERAMREARERVIALTAAALTDGFA